MRWLIRGFEYALFTVLAIIQLKAHQSINFHSILSNTNNNLLSRKEKLFFNKISTDLEYKKLVHRIILPMYNESIEIIRETLNNLAKSEYFLKNIAVTIA